MEVNWQVLFVENTTRCTLNCPSCKRQRRNEDMKMSTYETILSKFSGEGIEKVSFFWRGEPTMDLRLPQMAQMARDVGYSTYTSTNMVSPHMIKHEYVSALLSSLDRITACIDGYDQSSLEKYRRGADWSLLVKGLETMAKVKSDCSKEMRVLMFRHNEGHEADFVAMARKYKMDKLFFGLPIINGKRILEREEAKEWLSRRECYQRYRQSKGKWIHKDGDQCSLIPIISVNGDIAICCYDWNIRYNLGNIVEDDLRTINKNIMKKIPFARRHKLQICKTECFIPNIPVNLQREL